MLMSCGASYKLYSDVLQQRVMVGQLIKHVVHHMLSLSPTHTSLCVLVTTASTCALVCLPTFLPPTPLSLPLLTAPL